MLNRLNKYGLPAKYGLIGFFGGIIGAAISDIFGYNDGSTAYLIIPLSAGIGGTVGGWIRKRQGKDS